MNYKSADSLSTILKVYKAKSTSININSRITESTKSPLLNHKTGNGTSILKILQLDLKQAYPIQSCSIIKN